jgi:RecA-family ATPase
MSNYQWFDEPEVATPWLVYGLIPADGYSSIVGKPKAGKSTFVRNLAVAVIKGHDFLGRKVIVPSGGGGKVLYLQLDRKDKPGRVTAQFKALGLTKDDAPRLVMRLAEHLPPLQEFSQRLEWLRVQVDAAKPDLIVIDLLWQFVVVQNANDYTAVLNRLNEMQDALNKIKYQGAVIAVMHGRKATNPNDSFDDILGSTGQRGSFSTNVMLTQYKNDQIRTISSDQTDMAEEYGEILETVITRRADGTLALGQRKSELEAKAKESKTEGDLAKLITYIAKHPGIEMETITTALSISKKYALSLLAKEPDLCKTGAGKKGDPFKYSIKGYEPEVTHATIQ